MSKRYSRALVTGGAGFIGSHLCRRLLAEGMDVVVLDNLSMGQRESVAPECKLIQGDVCDTASVASALQGVDIVFHNAAKVSVRASIAQFVEDAQTNVLGTLTLLKQLAHTQVSKFVLASSMAVYADSPSPIPVSEDYPQRPLSPYGTGKLAAELYALQICGTLGIDVVPLRYFNTYGPGQTFTAYVGVVTIFATQLLKGQIPTIFGDGQQMRDFVSVHDIVAANLAAMNNDVTGQVFNIGSGRGLSVNEICRTLIDRINPSIQPDYAGAQAGEIRNSIADISQARNLLGYEPQGVFARDVAEVIQWIEKSPRGLHCE